MNIICTGMFDMKLRCWTEHQTELFRNWMDISVQLLPLRQLLSSLVEVSLLNRQGSLIEKPLCFEYVHAYSILCTLGPLVKPG